jgi:hypothetical protein
MRTRLTLRPGQRGTKRLARRFGDRLIAVRYRYDAVRQRRLKTVELIVNEVPWEPPASTLVAVRVRWDEPVLRGRVKAAGGRWDPKHRVWEVAFGAVRALALEDRLVEEESLHGDARSTDRDTSIQM